MKSRFSQNMQSNRRNRRILLSTVAVAVVVAAGVGGCYAAKQARIGVLRKQLAGLSTPLTLDYQRARYSPVTGVLKLHQVALSPAGTPQGASDNVWIIDTVRLEPLEGGLARAGRVALLDNRISNGFWASLKLAASADSPTAAHQAISDHNSKMLLGLKNKVFGDDPLVGNASWAYRLEDGGANGAQKLTLTDGLLENADGQLGLDTLQIDESATNSLGTAATAVQLDNLHFVGSDDASAPAAGNEDEESTSQQGQGENGAG
ncbi:MAG: hypothetical protein FJX22_01955, partial [Alphaproteobacteria bacterium]|nr:hypothetical protein [Alphaproteobacteria bacterium]